MDDAQWLTLVGLMGAAMLQALSLYRRLSDRLCRIESRLNLVEVHTGVATAHILYPADQARSNGARPGADQGGAAPDAAERAGD